jgi:phage terminase small subunit
MPLTAFHFTAKQEKYIDARLRGLNVTQATIAAGYSKRTAGVIGAKLAKNVKVCDEIRRRQQWLAKDAAPEAVTPKQIVRQLYAEAFSNIFDIVQIKDGHLQFAVQDSAGLHPLVQAGVASISESRHGEIRVKLMPRHHALEQLAKYLGLDLAGQQGKDEFEKMNGLRQAALSDPIASELVLRLAERLAGLGNETIDAASTPAGLATPQSTQPAPEVPPPGDEPVPLSPASNQAENADPPVADDALVAKYLRLRPKPNGESPRVVGTPPGAP